MRQVVSGFLAMLLCVGTSMRAAAGEIFNADLRGNRANQVIAGFRASTVDWDIERGRVSIISFGSGRTLLTVRTKGLIIPAFGFNPSPDILARVVCHNAGGTPFEAARTNPVPFAPNGDAAFVTEIALSEPCFAPLVLLTGSVDPAGNRPGNWFAVSGL